MKSFKADVVICIIELLSNRDLLDLHHGFCSKSILGYKT